MVLRAGLSAVEPEGTSEVGHGEVVGWPVGRAGRYGLKAGVEGVQLARRSEGRAGIGEGGLSRGVIPRHELEADDITVHDTVNRVRCKGDRAISTDGHVPHGLCKSSTDKGESSEGRGEAHRDCLRRWASESEGVSFLGSSNTGEFYVDVD